MPSVEIHPIHVDPCPPPRPPAKPVLPSPWTRIVDSHGAENVQQTPASLPPVGDVQLIAPPYRSVPARENESPAPSGSTEFFTERVAPNSDSVKTLSPVHSFSLLVIHVCPMQKIV